MVLRSTLNFRANSLLLIFIFTFSINSLSFGKSVRLEIVNSELISIAICIIFTSNKLCNNLSQLYIVIQSFLYILKLSFIPALHTHREQRGLAQLVDYTHSARIPPHHSRHSLLILLQNLLHNRFPPTRRNDHRPIIQLFINDPNNVPISPALL